MIRFCLRWSAVVFILLLLLLVVLGFFLNRLGLPEFIKERVVTSLRTYGWEVEFSRLRLRWYRGLVADHLQLQRAKPLPGPVIFVEEAQVSFDPEALKSLTFRPTSVRIRGGRLIWPLPVTQGRQRTLALDDVTGVLRFKSGDEWELHPLRGTYHGLRLQLDGTLTHASAIRDWTFPQRAGPGQETSEDLFLRLESGMDKLHLTGKPLLSGEFRGDARDLASFTAVLRFEGPALRSPWGAASNFLLSANLNLSGFSNGIGQVNAKLTADAAHDRLGSVRGLQMDLQFDYSWAQRIPTNATLRLEAEAAQTQWGTANHVLVTADTRASSTNQLLRQTDLKLLAQRPFSEWGQATSGRLEAQVSSPITNWLPASFQAELQLDGAQTRWGSAQQAAVVGHGLLPLTNSLLQTNRSWLERLAGMPLQARVGLTNITAHELGARRLICNGRWAWPQLHLELGAETADGRVDAAGELDAATRRLSFQCTNNADLKCLAPLFGTNAQRIMGEVTCPEPPKLLAYGTVVLPPWTNRPPDWRLALPTLSAQGQLQVDRPGWHGLELDAVQTTFSVTNLNLELSNLRIDRAPTGLEGQVAIDLRTWDFHARFRSSLDPNIIKPLFRRETEQRAFGIVRFTDPPRLEAEVWGRGDDWQRLGVTARAAITNFAVNGQAAKDCLAAVRYTNQFFSILAPQLQREGERAVGDGIGIDLARQRLYLTNVFGNVNPYALLRAINTNTARDLEPYQFAVSPTVRASGTVGLIAREHAEDLHFRVEGGPFHWKVFNLPKLSGDVFVLGETARLTNVLGQFYGGWIAGDARFDWSITNGTDFAFNLKVADANLRTLTADVSSKTNKLEGALDGHLSITSANSELPRSWQGYGRAELRDGLIWDFPFFGVFSTVLNSLVPGLGNSRAKEAIADYVITNSVIVTKDLNIRATAMRMHFDGRIGFDETVDGRMEAELLRDMPGVGIFVARVFWPFTKLFEYRVTGTLDTPKADPLYILPKMVLMPFHPIRTLKDVFSSPEPKTQPQPPPP